MYKRQRNVEVNRVGVHKGRGLEWLAHHLGCTLANIIAIGDSENDLTMLQMAGLGVAIDVYKRQAYDQLRYFKNKDTISYTNKTYADVLKMLAADYGLSLIHI